MLLVRDFKGEIPARDARLLPGGYARQCVNCDLGKGTIRPIKAMTLETPSVWTFLNEAGVDVVPANVFGVNRLLVSGLAGYPEAREGGTTRRWGVVTPGTIPTVSTGGTPEEDADVADTVSYCYTLVTAWGEESAISGASMPVDIDEGEYVILSNFAVPSLAASGNDFSYIRVYRTATGDAGVAEFQQVGVRTSVGGAVVYDVPVSSVTSTGSQLYDVNDSGDGLNRNLGGVAMTEGWDPPPDGAESGVEFSNGVYALAKGKRVYLSLPGYYYAFPHDWLMDYTFELQYDVVGLGVYNQQLIVCTEAYPEVISGVDPATASRYQFPFHFPCLSKKSIVSTPRGVFYVSDEGGVMATDAGVEVVTRNIFTPQQWRAYSLASAICAYWQQKIFVFFDGSASGFIIDLFRGDVVMLDAIGGAASDVFVDEEADRLYVHAGGAWRRWAGGDACLPATYETAVLVSHPTSFACARIDGHFPAAGDLVDMAVMADGSEVIKKEGIAAPDPFRTPGGSRYRHWSLRVVTAGSPEIYAVFLAHSMEELRVNV